MTPTKRPTNSRVSPLPDQLGGKAQKPHRNPSGPAQPDQEWGKLSQREKFIRTAREIGADEAGKALDEALKAIGRARKR